MKTLLHLDSSARKNGRSISKALAGNFSTQWRSKRPGDKIIYRDLGVTQPPYINQEWIASAFTADEERTDEQRSALFMSDTFIDEINEADMILLSTPMYNYGMPAVLKAWFDQVIRIDKTFTFDLARGDFPLEPIMSGKLLILVSSTGEFGFQLGGIRETMNHLGPHIKVLAKFLGVEKFYEIQAEYQEFGDQRHERSLGAAQNKIDKLVLKLLADID